MILGILAALIALSCILLAVRTVLMVSTPIDSTNDKLNLASGILQLASGLTAAVAAWTLMQSPDPSAAYITGGLAVLFGLIQGIIVAMWPAPELITE